jgi:hypothetical protein
MLWIGGNHGTGNVVSASAVLDKSFIPMMAANIICPPLNDDL